jgi:DNA-binding NarL/FixJ family response regulator
MMSTFPFSPEPSSAWTSRGLANTGVWPRHEATEHEASALEAFFTATARPSDAGHWTEYELRLAWEDFASGRARTWRSYVLGDRVYVAARLASAHRSDALADHEAPVLIRVLCGEQQKVVASELEVAPSTVSHRFTRSLEKLGIEDHLVPLPLVLAVQQQCDGAAIQSGMTCSHLESSDGRFVVLSTKRPDMRRASTLTHAEREVAALFIEGFSRSDIAIQRRTSVPTVARQIHCVFSTLRLIGRYALIRRAAELGSFG